MTAISDRLMVWCWSPGANTLKLLAQPVSRRTLQHRDGIHDVAQSCLCRLGAGRTHSEQPLVLPYVNPASLVTWAASESKTAQSNASIRIHSAGIVVRYWNAECRAPRRERMVAIRMRKNRLTPVTEHTHINY